MAMNRKASVLFSILYILACIFGKGFRQVAIVRNLWNIFRR